MKLGIGIDTGGTYTDAVIYDFDNKKVIGTAKALTTKEDLSIGIGNALDELQPDMLRKADVISLSTTLATNACVENKGGRAKQIFIGVNKKVVLELGKNYGLPNFDEMYFIDANSSDSGKMQDQPNWDLFLKDSSEWLNDAESVGIVALDAMKNNAVFEKKAKELISSKSKIPIICGYELYSDLNSLQRGSTTLLNARLLPIIENFLDAIKMSLKKRNIKAPVVIVRSDGSLMSEDFTSLHPIETLLCGPAASVLGGIELTHENNSLIIDMGGTTTDVALVKDGIPVIADNGINVGKWRTFVKGLYIDTFALGGDSAVRFNTNGVLVIEPARIIPLSIIADKWPVVIDKLKTLIETKKSHTYLLHEFYLLVKDISGSSKYTEQEISFCEALKDGPLIYSDAAAAIGTDFYNLKMHRLEKEGIIIRCGLTPTDIMHIKGDFNKYNSEAAKLGAEFVAACVNVSQEELYELVYDKVKKTLYINIVRMLLEDKYPNLKKNGIGDGIEFLISQSWETSKNNIKQDFFNLEFNTPASLVGIGAPIHIFLPDVAKALGARCVIPQYASVANALGALVGNITATCEIEVRPQYSLDGDGKYIVYGKNQNSFLDDKDQAIAIALDEVKISAKEEVAKRGALGDVAIVTEVIEDIAESKGKIKVLLGIKVIAKAVGRIAI